MTESQKVFKKAVKMAKAFTGDWIARMKLALKIVWKQAKKTVKSFADAAEFVSGIVSKEEKVSARAWEKYGKHRVYVNYYATLVGYFKFDENGKYLGSQKNYSVVDGGPYIVAFEDAEAKLMSL